MKYVKEWSINQQDLLNCNNKATTKQQNMLQVVASLVKFERPLIIKRTKAGLASAIGLID